MELREENKSDHVPQLVVAPGGGGGFALWNQSFARMAQARGGFRLEPRRLALSLSLSLSLPPEVSMTLYCLH